MDALTILIVEDNEKNLKLCRDLLELKGHRILEAADGSEGIDLARLHRPDLIIMDIQLPVLNGMKATAELHRCPETREIPVIALTAFAMKGDEERFLRAGFHGYIPKPIDTRRFSQQVEQVYATQHALRGEPAP